MAEAIVAKIAELIETIRTSSDAKETIRAFGALRSSGDQQAVPFLIEYLLNSQHVETYRSLAAHALGDLGGAGAVDVLMRVTDEANDEGMLKLAIACIVALATFNNHDKAPIAVDLVNYDDDPIIRVEAVNALQYVVAPGILPALQGALSDGYFEVRQAAVRAVFYLGVKESISSLVPCVEDDHPDVANNVRVRLHDLTDVWFTDTPAEDIRAWWQQHQDEYEKGICYRLGKPIWLPNIIGQLTEPNVRAQIVAELHVITGVTFNGGSTVELRDQHGLPGEAQRWWSTHADQFKAGHLYKLGYEQNISEIYAA